MNVTRLQERLTELWNITGGSSCCGWMVDEVAFYLYSLVKIYRPGLVVQTGHLWGKSSLFVLEAMTDGFLDSERIQALEVAGQGDNRFTQFLKDHQTCLEETRTFISVDPSPLGVSHADIGVGLLKFWYSGVFKFRKTGSRDFFSTEMDEWKRQYQGHRILTIVDGDHTESGCRYDLESSANLGAGIIVVDDVDWLPELDTVARDFAASNGYQYLKLGVYNGIGVLSK